MSKVYEIWQVRPQAYPLTYVISVMSGLYRDDVISTDRNKLEGTLKWLKATSPSNCAHEIREHVAEKFLYNKGA